jgi:hypothetical protein
MDHWISPKISSSRKVSMMPREDFGDGDLLLPAKDIGEL